MCHAFCHPSVKTLVFAGRARNPESPKLPECARMCSNVPECATNVLPNVPFFLKHKRGATPWWAPRGDTCGWSFFLIYDFNRSPWRRLSTPRRPGRPLQSPIDIMVAIHGCSKVLKARAILCPCLLPRGPWYACAEPFPNPGCSWASSHQKSSSSVGSSAAASSAVARPATVLKKARPWSSWPAGGLIGSPDSGAAHRPVEVGQYEFQFLRNFRTCL